MLWKTLEQWQRRAGLGQSPRTILDELERIQSTDVVLPTEDGRELRIRCVVRPDAAQAPSSTASVSSSRAPSNPVASPRTRVRVVPTFRLSARNYDPDPLELRKLG